jgi:hypothetical protein
VAADAAVLRTGADRVVVVGAADGLHAAAAAARYGAGEIAGARQLALQAVDEARAAGFTVGEDLSVTSRQGGPPAVQVARQAQAQMHAAAIRASAENLVAVDTQVATRISTAIVGLNTAQFADTASSGATAGRRDNPKKPTFQMVDNHTFKQDGGGDPAPDPPPPTPPARGLPPEGLRPPVDGPLTPGPASRPSEQGKDGQSLWDEHGGEWRYSPADKWHNPHWDYNAHSNPNSRWDNIPINGLPPRIGDAPPIISGLPPWLQNPAAPGVPGPPQNPLLAPFPGATMPAPPPAPAPAPAGGLLPHIDVPAPSPGDLQTAGGETAVVGGGGLLLLILGALALA